MTSPSTTHFGFKTVAAEEKASLVREVFDSVASRYDLMNDLMSAGVHRLWKDGLMDWLAPRPGMKLLDVAGGTGDIAFRFKERGGGDVVVCDINLEMLKVGRDRAVNKGILEGISWVCGDAQIVPIPSSSVDVYTIAFGLRNVTDIELAIQEALRVLRPGGRFMCLEFSRVVIPIFADLYERYSFEFLPKLGQMVAGNAEAYQYLVESIRKFPPQEELGALMEKHGFAQVKWRNYSGGIAALHSGWKI